MQVVKQSTIATILVGPVLDASGLAVTTAAIGDFNITKNGTSAAMSANTIAHSHNGHYTIVLTAANTDTLGRLTITVNNAAMAMAPFRFTVLTGTAFDALVTNGNIASSTSGRTIAVSLAGGVELDSAITAQIDNIENASGYLLAVLAGSCADPQTASETYAITVFGSTFTVDMAGQTSTGTRTAPTLTKS